MRRRPATSPTPVRGKIAATSIRAPSPGRSAGSPSRRAAGFVTTPRILTTTAAARRSGGTPRATSIVRGIEAPQCARDSRLHRFRVRAVRPCSAGTARGMQARKRQVSAWNSTTMIRWNVTSRRLQLSLAMSRASKRLLSIHFSGVAIAVS
jgi:hypothetical protein